MGIRRLEQIFVAEEAIDSSGVASASLFASGNGNFLVADPTLEFDVPYYERNIHRASLTRLQGLTGMQRGVLKFGMELCGTSAIGNVPPMGLLLRACGFRQETLIKLTVGTITSGPFKHGELVTQLTSGATGTVVGDTYTGMTTLWVTKGNGLGNATAFTTTGGHTLSAPSGAGTAAPSATNTSGGIGWWPFSFQLSKLVYDATGNTEAITDGDILQGQTSGSLWAAYGSFSTAVSQTVYVRRLVGHATTAEVMKNLRTTNNNGSLAASNFEAQFQVPSLTVGMTKDGVREAIKFSRGTVSFAGQIGEPMLLAFEFKGAKHAVVDGGNVSGITFTQSVPPVMLDSDITVGHSADTYAQEKGPNFRAFKMDWNADVQYQEAANDPTGIIGTLIAERKPTGDFDPELVPEADFSYMTDFFANTAFRARLLIGSTLGNKFEARMPGLSIVTAPTEERSGTLARRINFMLHGGSQGVSSTTTENEFVLILPYA